MSLLISMISLKRRNAANAIIANTKVLMSNSVRPPGFPAIISFMAVRMGMVIGSFLLCVGSADLRAPSATIFTVDAYVGEERSAASCAHLMLYIAELITAAEVLDCFRDNK